MKTPFKGRVTCKKLADWLNSELKRLEINNWVVTSVEPTRFRSQDYENGAAWLYIRYQHINGNPIPIVNHMFYCFYPISYLQKCLNSGYELYIRFDRNMILSNCELDIKKIQ